MLQVYRQKRTDFLTADISIKSMAFVLMRNIFLESPNKLLFSVWTEWGGKREMTQFKQANYCLKFCFIEMPFSFPFLDLLSTTKKLNSPLQRFNLWSRKTQSVFGWGSWTQTAAPILAYSQTYSSGCSRDNSMSFDHLSHFQCIPFF